MQSIFNSVPVGLYRTTLDGRILVANPTLAKLLGCPSVDAVLASNAADFYANPADRMRLLGALDRQGATVYIEAQLRRRDGSTFWAEVFGRRIDEGPEPALVGMIRDISARKQLELRVDQFARAAAASGEVIFMTDAAGVFTYVNPEFTRVYGYPADELIGRHTPRLLKSNLHSQEEYAAFWKELLSGTSVTREFTNRRKDGSLVLVDGTVNAVTNAEGATTGFLAIQRDITARRETERALHESEALFRRIFDQLSVGAALVSPEGRFHRANPAFCRMFGWSEAELQERTWVDITYPEERAKSAALVRALYAREVDQIDLEKRYVRKDGALVWGAVSVRLITDATGTPNWTMPVVVDVTVRRRLEDQLRQAQKMEAIGQLAGGIAHDFNNILTAIIGYSDLLADRVGADKTAASDLRQIHRAGLRAAALTRQLLAFSRKQVLRMTIADLNQVMAGFERFVRPIIGEDIELRFDLSPSPARLLADVSQLEQVAMNLIINARDAMPEGGTIRVRTAIVTIDDERAHRHEQGMAPGEYVELLVEDGGAGMSEDTKRRLFEPFFTTKPPGRGTGLGLAVAYGIVRQMGGFIWVYSEEGRGTIFKVYFPRAEPGRGTGAAPPATTATPTGNERILLVEDDHEVRVFAARVLRRAGYLVTEAASGTAALEQLHGMTPPDLVIADVVMPGMSGPEFARQLAERQAGVKVLFTSGYTDRRRAGLGEGMDLMEKPFTPAMLLSRVRATLDRREASGKG